MYEIVELFCNRAAVAMLLVTCLWLPCQGQSVTGSAELPPLPDAVAAPPVGTVAPPQNPPVVTYRDGQLAIDAENSTLAEVLQLVAEKTGALIDVPPGSGLERIVEHTGPGHAEDVLARLLNGSAFDFVIVGSSRSPRNPMQVLLFLHKTDAAAGKQDAVALASTPSAGEEPHLYGAGFRVSSTADNSAEALESVASSANQSPQAGSEDLIPGAVLDQLQKERLRQRQQMQQQTTPPPSSSNNSQ